MTRRLVWLLAFALLVGGALAFWRSWKPSPAAAPGSTIRVAETVPEIAAAASGRSRVLFVGLDGADWQLLDRYVEAGAMPNLKALVAAGRSGAPRTIQPPLSPLVWTTMMTGVSPLEHRVLDFTRFHPASGAREPITSDERRVPAVWTLASAAGRKVGVFGLWATYPAERVNGLVVSDRLFSFQEAGDEGAAPPAGIVSPPGREGWAREALAAAERETGCAEVRAYAEGLDAAECARLVAAPDPFANPVAALRRILVETRVYHALAADWIAAEAPDLAIVYFQGTDAVGHVFAPYAPPRMSTQSEADFARYGRVPERYFR